MRTALGQRARCLTKGRHSRMDTKQKPRDPRSAIAAQDRRRRAVVHGGARPPGGRLAPGRTAAGGIGTRRTRSVQAVQRGQRIGASVALPRTRFVLLLLGLLGGGLICLLVINTTLGAASFRVSQLQNTDATLSQQEQSLQQQVASEQTPAQIENRAYQLGMRPQAQLNFLDLHTHRYYQVSGQAGAIGGAGSTP